MPSGGPRPGGGPKLGYRRSIVSKAREASVLAAKKGGKLLPHEILLKAANGECFKIKRLHITYHKSGALKGREKSREWVEEEYYPDFKEQIDAAKNAAPYYVPRLAVQTTVVSDEKQVMFIPTANLQDWEEMAARQQERLKKEVRD